MNIDNHMHISVRIAFVLISYTYIPPCSFIAGLQKIASNVRSCIPFVTLSSTGHCKKSPNRYLTSLMSRCFPVRIVRGDIVLDTPSLRGTQLSQNTIEYKSNYEKAHHVCEKKLRKSLLQVPGITENQIDTIVEESIGSDEYMKAQNELNTEYKRKKYVQEHFEYVAPVEICLGGLESVAMCSVGHKLWAGVTE